MEKKGLIDACQSTDRNHLVFLFFSFLFLLVIPGEAQAAIHPSVPNEVVPRFESYFAGEGIGKEHSPENYQKLMELTLKLKEKVQSQLLAETFAPFDKKWFEEKEKFLEHSWSLLHQSLSTNLTEEEERDIFYQAKGIIYMLKATEVIELKTMRRNNNLSNIKLEDMLQGLARFIKRKKLFNVTIPPLNQPVGKQGAEVEAQNLTNPDLPEKVLTTVDIAQMTPLQIGALDISEKHADWFTKKYLQDHPDTWTRNELWLNKQITDSIKKEHGESRFQNFSYDLHKAQKVVFFEELKESGTTAKIKARDAFDIQWKIKWSDEIHSEVISNRLYLLLGGRYVDPVYSVLQGGEGTTLILKDRKEVTKQKRGCPPVTPEDFIRCIRNSKYLFELRPFLHSSGQVTKENYQEVLRHLPYPALPAFEKEKLIGRYFVTFNEALFELRPPKKVVLRGGPVSLNQFGAKDDRVLRGLLLFNALINNNDHREENSRGYILSKFPSGGGESKAKIYVRGQHDMGKTFGGIIGSGNPNQLFTGSQFMNRWPHTIQFNFFLFNLPGVLMKTTYPDLLWMGEKIARITRKQIEDIVAKTEWPDFMQKAMSYKLLARRNRVAHVLNLEHLLDEKIINPPSMAIPLGSEKERKLAAQKYGVPLEELIKAYEGRSRMKNFADKVLRNGRISPCESSMIIRLLHRFRHPTGLDRRLPRYKIYNKIKFLRRCGGVPNLDRV